MKEKIFSFIPFHSNATARQFYKFGIVGVSNTIVDFLVYVLLTRTLLFFSEHFYLANVLSFSIAVTNSFYWNRKWTFRSTDSRRTLQYFKFFVVNIAGLGINTGLLYVLVRYADMYDVFAKILAIGVALFWNFFINRLWVFTEKEKA